MFTEPVCIPTVSSVSKARRWRRLSAIDSVDRFTKYRSVELARVPAQLQVHFRLGWLEPKKVFNGCEVVDEGAICHGKCEIRIIGSKTNSSTSVKQNHFLFKHLAKVTRPPAGTSGESLTYEPAGRCRNPSRDRD